MHANAIQNQTCSTYEQSNTHGIAALVLVCALLYATNSRAETLKIGFIERPPSIFATADGQMRGILGKKLDDIFFRAQLDVEFQATLPEELDSFISNQSLDGFVASNNIVLNNTSYLYSESPLVSLMFYAYHLKETPAINGLDQLKNATVVFPVSLDAVRGTLKNTVLNEANNISIAAIESNFERQITLLRRKQADYAISYFNPNDIAMMFSSRNNRAQIQSSELFEIPLYLVLRASTPNSTEVIHKINRSMNGDQ